MSEDGLDLGHFKQLIEKKISDFCEDKNSHEKDLKDLKGEGSYHDSLSENGAKTQRRKEICLKLERIGKRLRFLNGALKRIENGTYGICASCGKPISISRLETVLETVFCRKCNGG